jgi:hypothetical protein
MSKLTFPASGPISQCVYCCARFDRSIQDNPCPRAPAGEVNHKRSRLEAILIRGGSL